MRKRRKDAGHPECNPPPVAPHFATGFAKILGLIESDVFLHCVSLVLRRADDLKARCFSENQVRPKLKVLGSFFIIPARFIWNSFGIYLALTPFLESKYRHSNSYLTLIGIVSNEN